MVALTVLAIFALLVLGSHGNIHQSPSQRGNNPNNGNNGNLHGKFWIDSMLDYCQYMMPGVAICFYMIHESDNIMPGTGKMYENEKKILIH